MMQFQAGIEGVTFPDLSSLGASSSIGFIMKNALCRIIYQRAIIFL